MSLIPYISDFDHPFRMMERDFLHPDKLSPFNQLVPKDFAPDFLKPWTNVFRPWDNYMRNFEELSNAMTRLAVDEMGQITSDSEKFQVNVDVHHFAPEEVSVTVKDGNVIVEGKHEEKLDQHGYVSRQFLRKYPLPQGCLPDTVQSKLSSDGVLTVTAPKVLPLPSIGERIVPIAQTGPIKKQIGF